jgi:ATP/maltotriose-dependent transcriptional regulator MalT
MDALAEAAGDEVIERVSPAPRFAGAVVVERLLAQLERLEEPLELVIDDLSLTAPRAGRGSRTRGRYS